MQDSVCMWEQMKQSGSRKIGLLLVAAHAVVSSFRPFQLPSFLNLLLTTSYNNSLALVRPAVADEQKGKKNAPKLIH